MHDGVTTRKIYARAYKGNYSSGGIMTLKNLLMEQGIVTCAQLSEKPELLKNLGLSQEKQQWVANELKEIER
ncbi:MAG: hypothetical protein SCM96_11905 [Acidobacteriota bacterium]|nr:hypothetical protein [Acidobacteriota bacterium]